VLFDKGSTLFGCPHYEIDTEKSLFVMQGTAMFQFNPTAADINKTARILLSATRPPRPQVPERAPDSPVPCFVLLELTVVAPPPAAAVAPLADGALHCIFLVIVLPLQW
jgi:hypothetical protein